MVYECLPEEYTQEVAPVADNGYNTIAYRVPCSIYSIIHVVTVYYQ